VTALSPRDAIRCCAAALLAYVGVVHEVVGATLYPYGPAAFGGPLGWHAAGLALVALGLLAGAGLLGVVQAPVALLGAVGAGAGAVALAGEALQHGGFHFFAFTMVVAGAILAGTRRERRVG
jgi:hypothetical protein